MVSFRNLSTNILHNLPEEAILRKALRKLLPSGIRNRIGRYLVTPPAYLKALDRIGHEVNKYYRRTPPAKPLRILFGPSFSIYEPCFIHDRILCYALRLRGAEIHPMYCDSAQSVECDYWGGLWLGQKSFAECCKGCANKSQLLWRDSPTSPFKLSRYLRLSDIEAVNHRTEYLDAEQWALYTEDGMPFGEWAKDILVNNYLVGDYHLVPDYHRLGLAHLRNLLQLNKAYRRIIDEVKPDRAISNDSYYGVWAILQKLFERQGIPYYSHWVGARKGGWCYAYNDAAMNLDFSRPWNKFSQIPLDERQKNRVQQWLDGRRSGKEMILDTASAAGEVAEPPELSRIIVGKPTALLAANVIWDLAALNKQVVFADMIDWIVQTVRWFEAHPEYQLIIKPHPGELHPAIPATKERVEVALAERAVHLPDNVLLLPPRVNLSVYQLFPLVQVMLAHTTTVGIEIAAGGLPVITTARSPYRGFGFTLDPSTKQEYFDLLGKTLRREKLIDVASQIDLAHKFILFYYYHYYTKIDIMDYTWGKHPQLKVKSVAELFEGKNKHLDYIIDSIIKGLPILTEDRWPAES